MMQIAEPPTIEFIKNPSVSIMYLFLFTFSFSRIDFLKFLTRILQNKLKQQKLE